MERFFSFRLPVHERIKGLESKIFPFLDKKINTLVQSHKIDYFNFADSSQKYSFTDGLHLAKESGELISKQIANLILQKNNLTHFHR